MNMSYCMFENTSIAISQLDEAICDAMDSWDDDEIRQFIDSMNPVERAAFNRISNQAHRLMLLIDDISTAYEIEQENDNE